MAQSKDDDRPAERRMSHLNWMEFAEWVPDPIATVLVPVGTLEAHGITSLGTDNEIATHLAEALAERLNAFVAPTIPYGVTAGLGALAGGTHVKASAFGEYVAAVLTTLTHQGFRKVVVMNGHGGNNEALRDALRRVHEETGAYVASFQWWTECYPIAEEVYTIPGGHAGVDETAAMIAIAPDQVFADRWDPSLAIEARSSLLAYPTPGSILYYGGKRSDPVLDVKKARAYWARVVEHSGDVLEDLVVRWEREGFPAPRPRRASARGHVGHGGTPPGGGGNGHDKSGSGGKKKSS
ncbi:MAG TPA: creatininase family protein [Candidatus Eisenbacteria bacterium]